MLDNLRSRLASGDLRCCFGTLQHRYWCLDRRVPERLVSQFQIVFDAPDAGILAGPQRYQARPFVARGRLLGRQLAYDRRLRFAMRLFEQFRTPMRHTSILREKARVVGGTSGRGAYTLGYASRPQARRCGYRISLISYALRFPSWTATWVEENHSRCAAIPLQTGGYAMPGERKTIEIVQDLIRNCCDARQNYRYAAEHANDQELRAFFSEQSVERGKFASELQRIAGQELGSAEVHTSGAGAAVPGWVAPKHSAGDTELLHALQRREALSRKIYEEALAQDLPDNLPEVVRRQTEAVRAAYDHLDLMRQRISRDRAA